MILTIDIGNSNTVLGVFDNNEMICHFRIASSKDMTSDEYGITIREILKSRDILETDIKGSIIACVVPSLSVPFIKAVSNYLNIEPLVVGPGVKTGISIQTDNPKEVGADRIVNAAGAFNTFNCPLLIVDFGTAITFDYVTIKGEYKGGVIMPGLGVATEALFTRAAKLPKVDIKKPDTIIGKNTIESIQSGIYNGYTSLVNGMIKKILDEIKESKDLKIIATGGEALLLREELQGIDIFDEFLTLKGLKIIYNLNK